MVNDRRPIAVFDSGVGGVSVLRELLIQMPNENYIYFGDSANAPYGSKSHDDIRTLTMQHTEKLVQNAKALVIACNTATSVAIDDIRRKYTDIPIIGVEPAVKPATERFPGGKILVMATPATLNEHRFIALATKYKNSCDILRLPCYKLAGLIEQGHVNDSVVNDYIRELLAPYKNKVDCVVLGCTHYPFVKNIISKNIGENTIIFDGAYGTAKETKHKLTEKGLITQSMSKGTLEILTSANRAEFERIVYKLLEL